MVASPPHVPIDVDPETEIKAAAGTVRVAFGTLVSALPAGSRDLVGLMSALGLRRTLAWKVVRVSRAKDPLSAAEHIPGPEGVAILLSAAEAAGISKAACEQVHEATKSFYAMVGRHADSRPALRRLVRGMSSGRAADHDVMLRRTAVETNRAIWGVHAHAQYDAAFIFAHRDELRRPDKADVAIVRGFVDLVRARPDVSWEFSRNTNFRSHRSPTPVPLVCEPLFPRPHEPAGTPLIEEFCSIPLPNVDRSSTKDFAIVDIIRPGGVGKSAASTVLAGERHHDHADRWGPAGRWRLGCHGRTPVDTMVAEVFWERAALPFSSPHAYVFDMLSTTIPFPNAQGIEPLRMNVQIETEFFESADQAPPSMELPRHAALLERVFERIGRSASEFSCFRARLRYPPVPSIMMLHLVVPTEAPA